MGGGGRGGDLRARVFLKQIKILQLSAENLCGSSDAPGHERRHEMQRMECKALAQIQQQGLWQTRERRFCSMGTTANLRSMAIFSNKESALFSHWELSSADGILQYSISCIESQRHEQQEQRCACSTTRFATMKRD
jgi:hypothetical protein